MDDPEKEDLSQAMQMEAILEKEKQAETMLQEAKASCAMLQQEAQEKQQEIIEQARQQAEQLKEDAKAAGHEEGFTAGHAEGMTKAKEECAATIREANAKAERTMKTAQEEMQTYLQQAENEILEITLHIVEKILPQHFIDVPQVILPLIRKALLKVKEQAHVIVHVAPDAYELVLMAQPEFQSLLEGKASLEVQSDDSLGAGDCILETSNGNVDARLATQLELIKKAVQDVRL